MATRHHFGVYIEQRKTNTWICVVITTGQGTSSFFFFFFCVQNVHSQASADAGSSSNHKINKLDFESQRRQARRS